MRSCRLLYIAVAVLVNVFVQDVEVFFSVSECGEGVRAGGGSGSVNDVCDDSAVIVSGRDNVDVDGSGDRALGRSIGIVIFSLDLFVFTRPVTPLVTTWGWTPRKGTSRPIIPMMLCWNVTLDKRMIASEAKEPPMLCPIRITSRVLRGL